MIAARNVFFNSTEHEPNDKRNPDDESARQSITSTKAHENFTPIESESLTFRSRFSQSLQIV